MKKILSSLVAGFVLAGILVVSSCKDADEYTYTTVAQLDAPSVTVKAYPGVNIVTWNAVKDAQNYDLYVKIGDNQEVPESLSTTNLYYADTIEDAIVAGKSVSYRYRLVAKPQSSANKTFKASEATVSVSTKNTAAANGTKFSALNANTYENEFDSNATVLANDKITVNPLVTSGYATVSFPVKSYAKYEIYLKNTDKPTLTSAADNPSKTVEGASYKNNATATVKVTNLTNGAKTVTVKAIPYYEGYEAETFTSTATIKVAALGANVGSNPNAAYTNATTARIYWEPGTVTLTGKNTPTTYYKVYRKDADNNYTAVSGTVTSADKSGTVYYYIDDTIDNNKVAYTYYIAATDGTSYASSNLSVNLNAYSETATATPSISLTAYVDGTDNAKTSIKIVTTKGSTTPVFAQTLKLYYATLDEKDTLSIVSDSAWKEITLANYNSNTGTYYNYLENQAAGLYIFKVVASETGKKDAVKYGSITVNTANVSYYAGTLTVVGAYDSTTQKYTKNTITYTDSLITASVDGSKVLDAIDDYTFTLSKVVVTTTKNTASTSIITNVSTETLETLKPTLISGSTTNFKAEYVDNNVESSTTGVGKAVYYYVTKAAKDGTSVRTSTKTGVTN